ncbi:hypothetical protein P171DRAFT_37228 [Karstenula rhodostoma CBS 690.94]|uniref:Uncharacterized protein n=1 Tax=Karstenula rhodostoma CBS 690.94 TaxID=1392251 RepID=A0A9P4UBK9_9PLEO|nr:hypothetical protein P171DRAFT_37228 [Karstenula rhodostoma CBS 690.94]
MSGAERPPEPSVPTTGLKRKQLSDQDQEDQDQLDGIFKRIKTAVPRAPYILSTPSLNPYRYHSSQEARAWMLGHLFKHDEEYLQYRTYLFREPYRDCFTLQPGEDDEPEAPLPRSQSANVASERPKKKISLADYKNKQANGASAPGSKKVSPALQPTKPNVAQTNGVKSSNAQAPAHEQEKDSSAQSKRPEKKSSEKPDKRDRAEPPAPSSQNSESAEFKMNIDRSGPSNSTPHGLPPLLSPVEQPLSNPHGLPTILSPTLPPNIQVELDRIETRSRADSNTSTSSSDRNRSQHLHVPERTASKKPVTTKDGETSQNVSRARSISTNGKSPTEEQADHSDAHEPSLIVKLRFSKKSRENLKRLLALPPKRETPAARKERDEPPPKPVSQSKAPDSVEKKAKSIPKVAARRPEHPRTASKAPVPAIKVTEKRPRAEDDSALASPVPAKRPRSSTVSSQQDRPITPRDQITSSPVASNKLSAQKSQGTYVTPRKDLKAVNMFRTNSTESLHSTPGRSGATPTGARLDPQAHTSMPPLGGKKQMDISLLQQSSMKLNQMGRSLKHEGQKLERDKAAKFTKADQKHAAVIGLECILSYMAAYHAQDQSLQLRGRSAEVESTWKTLLPLCTSYGRLTKDFAHLDGFRSYLGAVIAANICTQVTPRAPNPKAHDSPHELSVAELTKQHSQLTENLGLLSDHYQKLQRHTQDARVALPMEELEKTYPKTWAGAEWNAKLAKAGEKVHATKLSGPYFLPILNDTSPIQAVRFGLRFLGEYCEREGVGHRLKINLERPGAE